MTEFSIESITDRQSLGYDSTLEDNCYDEPPLVSDRVQNLANNIYQEFEIMIEKYGNGVVEKLMPMIIGMLEGMDQLYSVKQRLDIELELVKEDKEQVISQYEREKLCRKSTEEKLLKVEDENDGMKKELESKIENLESMLKVMELKAKNSQEHFSRFEEKEMELKKDYNHLHERYTELFRSHMEYIDRTKLMIQQQSVTAITSSSNATQRKPKKPDPSKSALVHQNINECNESEESGLYDSDSNSQFCSSSSQFCASDEFENDVANKELGGWRNGKFPLNENVRKSSEIDTQLDDTDFATAMAGMEAINDGLFSDGNDYDDFLKFDDINPVEEFDDAGYEEFPISKPIRRSLSVTDEI